MSFVDLALEFGRIYLAALLVGGGIGWHLHKCLAAHRQRRAKRACLPLRSRPSYLQRL